jgi:hypothetical protein
MQQEAKEINLDNLDGGGLMELASREFHKICDNIADPNVRTEATRKMVISIEVKPDRKGQSADIAYSVKSTLAGPDKAKTTAFIAMAPGSSDISLFGVDVRQADLFPEGEQQPGPVAMPSKVVNQ